jgi:hypothetical protein
MVGRHERKRLIDQHSREPVYVAAAVAVCAAGALGLIGVLSVWPTAIPGDTVTAPKVIGSDTSALPFKVRADSD